MSIDMCFTSSEIDIENSLFIKKMTSSFHLPKCCALKNKCEKVNNYELSHCHEYHHENLDLNLLQHEIIKRKCYHHHIQKTQYGEEMKFIDMEHRGESCFLKTCKKGTDCKYLSMALKKKSIFNCLKHSKYLKDCHTHLTTYSHPETRETYHMRINKNIIGYELEIIVDSLNISNKYTNNLIQIDTTNRFSRFDYLSDIYKVTLILKKVSIHIGKVLNGYKIAFSIIDDNCHNHLLEKNKVIGLIESIDRNINFLVIPTENQFQKMKYTRIEIKGKFKDIFGLLKFISQNL